MAVTFDEVSKAQYVLLTTFTKDGRPKPTPIWIARDGDRALVITEKNSWKAKRIRIFRCALACRCHCVDGGKEGCQLPGLVLLRWLHNWCAPGAPRAA